MAAIIPPVSTVGNLPVTVSWIEGYRRIDTGTPLINNFVSPAVNPLILAAAKVQNSKNITEGDNYIKAFQDMLITASFPMIKLWDSILKI